MNEYLEGKTFEKEGAKIEDVQVSLRENGMICSLRATQIDSGLSAGLTVQGTLSVDNGTAYFQVGDFTLDSSIQGFARLIANATIESIIKQYSTPQGIPLPISQVEFYDLQVTQGNIVIVGHTR
ncbi:MAG: hypothetical protein A2Y73_09120 [Chloroflexi bacterium RBG_13_56_8]|nr:MAG: hypothetical protein A2Y73_09120 [Chloroflexi bacterium RBG_13_56_8]